MQTPRWLTLFAALIGANVGAVILTSAIHLATAQEPTVEAAQATETQSVAEITENTLVEIEPGTAPADSDGLSEIPSLGSVDLSKIEVDESPQNDPMFKEIQAGLADMLPGFEGPGLAPNRDTRALQYEQIQRRLETVQALTTAAMNLVQEAREVGQAGNADQAEDLILMSKQLRKMAAELLH